MSRIILASASPRRKELLEQIGVSFDIVVSGMPEQTEETEGSEIVKDLSRQKADHVWRELDQKGEALEDTIVIGADTIVSVWGQILGKPCDEEDAKRMLSMLQGNTHQVFTGVTFFWMQDGTRRHKSFYECTDVTMYPMSLDEISDYINTKEPMDKAGAYAIQGLCAAYVQAICGDYNNVVGLPVGRLYQELRMQGLL